MGSIMKMGQFWCMVSTLFEFNNSYNLFFKIVDIEIVISVKHHFHMNLLSTLHFVSIHIS